MHSVRVAVCGLYTPVSSYVSTSLGQPHARFNGLERACGRPLVAIARHPPVPLFGRGTRMSGPLACALSWLCSPREIMPWKCTLALAGSVNLQTARRSRRRQSRRDRPHRGPGPWSGYRGGSRRPATFHRAGGPCRCAALCARQRVLPRTQRGRPARPTSSNDNGMGCQRPGSGS
jgi:hypothetical protein